MTDQTDDWGQYLDAEEAEGGNRLPVQRRELRRNMKQKTRKGSKHEDRWLGPYTIVELSKTTCRLTNGLGKILKTRINLSQLKPYLSPLDQKHIESEDGLADQSGDDDVVRMSQPIQLRVQLRKSQASQMRQQLRQSQASQMRQQLRQSQASQTRKQLRQRQVRQQLRQSCLIQLHQIQKRRKCPHESVPAHQHLKEMLKKRRKNVTSNNSSNDPYDVETHISKQKVTRWWKKSLGLSVTDKKILNYHHKWLVLGARPWI